MKKLFLLPLLFLYLPGWSQVNPHKKMNMSGDTSLRMQPNQTTGVIKRTSSTNSSRPKIVEYDLYIADTMVNFTGKHRHAIAVNGKIPAPTVEFTEGDTACYQST